MPYKYVYKNIHQQELTTVDNLNYKFLIPFIVIILFIVVFTLLQHKNLNQVGYINNKLIVQSTLKKTNLKKDNVTLQKVCSPSNNKLKHKKLLLLVSSKLKQNNINNKTIKNYLNRNAIKFQPGIIAANLGFIKEINKKIKTPYRKRLRNTMSKEDFVKKYKSYLENISEKYNIPITTIVSILWIESKFGADTGSFNTLNVFFNLSLLQYSEVRKEILLHIKNKYPNANMDKLNKYAQKKGNWGFKEMLALLSLNNKLDSKNLYGSYAGAFGIAQFLPSSYIRYAKDGNEDKKIDLFNIYDSITSVANYLAKHNYNKSQKNAILAYNNSIPYLNKVIFNLKKIKTNKELSKDIPINKFKKDILKMIRLNNKLY